MSTLCSLTSREAEGPAANRKALSPSRGGHRERRSREDIPRHSGALPDRLGRGFRFRFRYCDGALRRHLARFRPRPRRSLSRPPGPRLRMIGLGERQDNRAGGKCDREAPRRLLRRGQSAHHEEGDARVILRRGPGSGGVSTLRGAGPGRRYSGKTGGDFGCGMRQLRLTVRFEDQGFF